MPLGQRVAQAVRRERLAHLVKNCVPWEEAYAVSRLIEQGANILLVSRVAGHAKPSVTLDVYAHLFAEGIEEAAVKFDPLSRGRWEVDGAASFGP